MVIYGCVGKSNSDTNTESLTTQSGNVGVDSATNKPIIYDPASVRILSKVLLPSLTSL